MSHAGAVNGVFGTLGVLLITTATASYRRGPAGSPARTALAASLGTLGVSFVVQSPAARSVQNDVIVNLGQLTGNGTTLISAYLLQVMMLHILYGQQRAPTLVRRWSIPLIVALAGLSGFFLATPTTADKFASPDAPAGVLTYYLIYACYLGVTLGAMVVLLRRYASQVADRWLRRSLRLYEWSCLVGMLYLAGRIGDLVIGRVDADSGLVDDRYGTAEFLVAAVLPALAFALVLAAVTIRNAGRATEYRLADRRLRPLWEAVRAVRPYAVLPVPRRAGARLRLYRRVIEIQDAELAAAERVGAATLARIDAAVAEAGLTGEDARATRDAAILAAGLAALSAGEPRPDGPASGQPFDDEADLAAVVRRLQQVSAAFTGAEVVRRFA